MTEPCEKGWVLVHIATDSQVVRQVIARSEAVCGTHGDLWPCMSKDDDTKEEA